MKIMYAGIRKNDCYLLESFLIPSCFFCFFKLSLISIF
jgi:hypothetical protein